MLSRTRDLPLVLLASLITMSFVFLAVLLESPLIALSPIGILGLLLLLKATKNFYFLFALLLPFSIEMELPGGFSTDLPTEPIMWLLTFIASLYLFWKSSTINLSFWKSTISAIMFLHIAWIGALVLISTEPVFSIKFFLAKLWYVIPFYFFFGLMVVDRQFVRKFIKLLLGATLLAVSIVMVRHGMEGFSFRAINDCVHPIYRNHVNYAVMLVALLPYLIWLRSTSDKKGYYSIALIFLVVAIYFSYTRAAIAALFIGAAIYIIIRIKMVRVALITSFLAVAISVPYFIMDNRFMDYTPNFEKTIAHYKFDNLLEATYKLQDISTMERLYRWMAGIEMVKEKPIFGFGPATFYSNYQKYTITAFETYVSNNPERSGIHNYYLMTLVEQGFVGLLIWLGLLVAVFIQGERKYHRLKDAWHKNLIIGVLCSIGMVAAILGINDLMEVDKIGPIVFMGMAIIGSINDNRLNAVD